MPTWLIERGFSFRIFAADCDEPCHVHVRGHGGDGKIWLPSLEIAHLRRYTRQQEALIMQIIAEHGAYFMERWDEFCGQQTEG
jgi:hypothetical protein